MQQKHDHLQLERPPLPEKYSDQYLDLAAQIFQRTDHFILNPRDTQATRLDAVDEVWVSDLIRYLDTLKYYEDYQKRPAMMQ